MEKESEEENFLRRMEIAEMKENAWRWRGVLTNHEEQTVRLENKREKEEQMHGNIFFHPNFHPYPIQALLPLVSDTLHILHPILLCTILYNTSLQQPPPFPSCGSLNV